VVTQLAVSSTFLLPLCRLLPADKPSLSTMLDVLSKSDVHNGCMGVIYLIFSYFCDDGKEDFDSMVSFVKEVHRIGWKRKMEHKK
jgi:hypothetical protein